jgi:hypothetical protein
MQTMYDTTIHPALAAMSDNYKFTHPGIVYMDIKRTLPNKSFDYDDIVEWCAKVEATFIGDIDKMFIYECVPLTINKMRLAKLPCNIFKLEDIFTDIDNSDSTLPNVGSNGAYLYGFPISLKEGAIVYINYVGIPIDVNGDPLIVSGHEEACKQYCMTQILYEDYINQKVPMQIWMEMDRKFSGMITACKQDMRQFTREDFNKLIKIRASMISRIGRITLKHNHNRII